MEKQELTYQIKIYLSGPIEIVKQCCRKYCLTEGLCVTVSPTLFIYTGGEEFGVEIGLLNYPRFPSSKEGLMATAKELAAYCRDEAGQHSYLILAPEITIWNTTREQ